MPVKPVDVKPESQKIKDNSFLENLSFSPGYVKEFFVNNIITRAISHLVGLSSTGAKMLSCTTAGVLKTSTVGSGYENTDTKTGTSADAYSAGLVFDSIASTVDIWIWTNDVDISCSKDGTTFDDLIRLPAGTMYSFDRSTYSIKVKSHTPGSHGTYQIAGYF